MPFDVRFALCLLSSANRNCAQRHTRKIYECQTVCVCVLAGTLLSGPMRRRLLLLLCCRAQAEAGCWLYCAGKMKSARAHNFHINEYTQQHHRGSAKEEILRRGLCKRAHTSSKDSRTPRAHMTRRHTHTHRHIFCAQVRRGIFDAQARGNMQATDRVCNNTI